MEQKINELKDKVEVITKEKREKETVKDNISKMNMCTVILI
jgi:hypothetical protein